LLWLRGLGARWSGSGEDESGEGNGGENAFEDEWNILLIENGLEQAMD
jgi:hypothetical protein